MGRQYILDRSLVEQNIDLSDIELIAERTSIPEATKCEVKKQINGEYNLSMTYPIGGENWQYIQVGQYIWTPFSELYDVGDVFQIIKTSHTLAGVIEVDAQHISYELANTIQREPTYGQIIAAGGGIDGHMTAMQNNIIYPSPIRFYFWHDFSSIANNYKGDLPPTTTRKYMFDWMAQQYDADWVFLPNNQILFSQAYRLHPESFSHTIEIGKNLSTLVRTLDGTALYDAIYPYYIDSSGDEEVRVELSTPDKTVSFSVGTEKIKSILPFDVSNYPGAQGVPITDTILRQAAQWYHRWNQSNLIDSFQISYVDLGRALEYASGYQLDKIDIHHSVHIVAPIIGIDVTKQITECVYDALTERNKSIIVGDLPDTLAKTILRR